jgi:hypothetical protein
MMTLICGITPEACTLRLEHVGISRQRRDAFLDARAARIVEADDRGARLQRLSCSLQIFSA